jgi:uncharacterized repeat protein (TIGR01451 family)
VSVAAVESDVNGTTIEIQVPDIQKEERTLNGNKFQALTLAGYDYTGEVGKPQMPVIRETVAIPDGASVKATVVDASSSTLKGYKVYPVQQPELDSDEDGKFVIDADFYSQNVFYPEEIVQVGTPAIWRDIAVVDLQVNPVQYNPATGELKVYKNIKVQLDYSGGAAVAKTVDPEFDQIYRSNILNYDSLNITQKSLGAEDIPATEDTLPIPDGAELDGSPISTSIKLLSIRANPTIPFANIRDLLDWHKMRGLPYVSYGLTEPASAASVKSLINTIYTSHPELQYVLLVGDIDLINWQADWNGVPGDYWYACLTGGTTPDLYPEVAVGRLTVNNTTELTTQINKIMTYSDNPPVSNWVDKALLVAHKQEAPGKYQGCKETIRTTSYSDSFTFDTCYGASAANGGDAATNADVTTAINAGRGIVNYRGHGGTGSPYARPWGTYWGGDWNTSNQEWTTSNAHALSNGDKTPVVFSISCLNNALDNPSNECLGEAFVKDDDSAVAFLGATRPSYTTPNHDFDRYLFDAIGNEHIYNIGMVLNDANVELISLYGSTSAYMDNLRIYLWLGDPALELWSATPKTLTVNYPSTVINSITVTVKDGATNVQNALVCLTKGASGSDIYTYGYTNSSGQATFSFTASYNGNMNVSVTKHNYLPDTGTTSVITSAPTVAVTSPNGGESWGVGEVHNITWTTTGTVSSIRLYYSIDGGTTYPYTIASGLSNTGTYAWTIPDTTSSACRVKVVACADAGCTISGEDVSNANFAIVAPDISVKPPTFDVTLPPDTTWSGKLTISNLGGQGLTYEIIDTETTPGPYFKWLKQTPYPLPAYTTGKMEAMVGDPDGLADIDYVRLWVMRKPGDAAYMYDNGVAPDEVAGDGIYTHYINGVTTYGEEVLLLFEAKDTDGNCGYASYPVRIEISDVSPADEGQYGLISEAVPEEPTSTTDMGTLSGSEAAEIEPQSSEPVTDTSHTFDSSAYLVAVAAGNTLETEALHDTLTEFGLSYVDITTVAEAEAAGADVIIGNIGLFLNVADVNNYVNNGGGFIQIGDWVDFFANDYEAIGEGTSVTVTVDNAAHPVCQGLPGSWTTRGLWSYGYGSYDYVGWVTDTSKPSIASVQADGYDLHYRGVSATYLGAGKAVYLGFNVYGDLAGSNDKLLFKNALDWVARPDCPWLDESPKSGSVAAHSSQQITVNIDTSGLAVGQYSAEMYIVNSDVGENPTIVPVQLTVKPAIETGAILFDETHNPYYTISGLYSDLAALLTSWGFTVNNATVGPITYDLLSDYCAVVISNPRTDYTNEEIAAIAEYVNQGGGLLIIGEWGSWAEANGVLPIVNGLAAPFSMSFNNDIVRDDIHNDGGFSSWPLIPDFDASVVGPDVDTIVEYAGCSIGTTSAAFPIAWAYSSAHTDMADLMDILMDTDSLETGETATIPALPEVVQTEVPEGIDAATGEEPATESAAAPLAPIKDTDAGGKVLWDLTHGVFTSYEPSGYYSQLTAMLTEKGYTVETTSAGVENVNLDEYAVLVICLGSSWYSAYTVAEVEVISNFVANGGGLLVMGDNTDCPNANINPVAQEYGTTCGISYISPLDLYISDLAAHPIFDGVTQIYMRAAGEIDGSTAPSQEVAWDDSGLAVVSVASGSGRVVITGDNSLWHNDYIANAQNQLFAENVFDWLSTPPEQTAVMAASLFGSGRAVVIGDGGVFQNSDPDGDGILSMYEYDNEKLAVNITDWLCGQGVAEPDLAISEKNETPQMPQKYLHSVKPVLNPTGPIRDPVETGWHELYPTYCTNYYITNWKDISGDKVLSPSDLIVLENATTKEQVVHRVDRMTITILVNKSLAFECLVPYPDVAKAMANPTGPFWHQVWPTFCIDYAMTGWDDNDKNGILSAGDAVALRGVAPDGEAIRTTVDEVSWDIIASPELEENARTYMVTYTVRNQGTATANRGHSATLYVDDPKHLNPVEHQVIPVDLAPGDTATLTFRTVVTCTDLKDTITVCADDYDQVNELDESNNCLSNTYACCTPSIEVIKQVWSPKLEQWVESINAQLEQTVRFRCTISNNGECCDLTKLQVGDVLSDSLKYANNATVNGKSWEPTEVGTNRYEWDLSDFVLPPGESIIIEFDAVVVKWSEQPDINLQWAKAYCAGLRVSVYDEDTASVQPFICGDVNMDANVDMTDVMILWYDIANYGSPPPEISNACAADVNCDGAIDMTDVMILWYDIANYGNPPPVVSCCDYCD